MTTIAMIRLRDNLWFSDELSVTAASPKNLIQADPPDEADETEDDEEEGNMGQTGYGDAIAEEGVTGRFSNNFKLKSMNWVF